MRMILILIICLCLKAYGDQFEHHWDIDSSPGLIAPIMITSDNTKVMVRIWDTDPTQLPDGYYLFDIEDGSVLDTLDELSNIHITRAIYNDKFCVYNYNSDTTIIDISTFDLTSKTFSSTFSVSRLDPEAENTDFVFTHPAISDDGKYIYVASTNLLKDGFYRLQDGIEITTKSRIYIYDIENETIIDSIDTRLGIKTIQPLRHNKILISGDYDKEKEMYSYGETSVLNLDDPIEREYIISDWKSSFSWKSYRYWNQYIIEKAGRGIIIRDTINYGSLDTIWAATSIMWMELDHYNDVLIYSDYDSLDNNIFIRYDLNNSTPIDSTEFLGIGSALLGDFLVIRELYGMTCFKRTTNSIIKSDEFLIYPNPNNSDLLNIKGIKSNFDLEVINSNGLVMDTFKANTYSSTLNISNYPNGIYILRFRNENNEIIEKLIRVK